MKLAPNQIDLWVVEAKEFQFNDLKLLTQNWLTNDERKRVERLKVESAKHEFLLGRYMLRSILSLYGSLSPKEYAFEYNDYGKPFVASTVQEKLETPLFFNLSHSKGKLILGVARHEVFGVDIECGLKPRRVEKIASRYFSQSEVQDLSALTDLSKQERFYDLWSLKEAYIKACGLGLAIPLSDFSYRFFEPAALAIEFSSKRKDVAQAWQFWQIDSLPDYHVSIAIKPNMVQEMYIGRFLKLRPLGELESLPIVLKRKSRFD